MDGICRNIETSYYHCNDSLVTFSCTCLFTTDSEVVSSSHLIDTDSSDPFYIAFVIYNLQLNLPTPHFLIRPPVSLSVSPALSAYCMHASLYRMHTRYHFSFPFIILMLLVLSLSCFFYLLDDQR